MISVSLDRFGGVTEPEDGVYFMTNEQIAKPRSAKAWISQADLGNAKE